MTQIVRATSKGQVVPLSFFQDAVAASQTNVQLNVVEVASAAALTVAGYVAPWDGEIVGVSYSLDAAATTGSFSVGATINGTEDADTTLSATTEQTGYKRVPRGKATFSAGDEIGVELTTSADLAPTTSDIGVTVWALVYLEGI